MKNVFDLPPKRYLNSLSIDMTCDRIQSVKNIINSKIPHISRCWKSRPDHHFHTLTYHFGQHADAYWVLLCHIDYACNLNTSNWTDGRQIVAVAPHLILRAFAYFYPTNIQSQFLWNLLSHDAWSRRKWDTISSTNLLLNLYISKTCVDEFNL